MKLTNRVLIASGLCIAAFNVAAESYLTKYCSSTVFRETPFSDIRCANELSKEDAQKIKHFQFDYDKSKRLVEVRYQLGTKLLPYSDRFVRAPKTVIEYKEGQEIRTYFDENGFPTLVSGDVHKSIFTIDKNGERQSLGFLGLSGEAINNDFGIAHYRWKVLDDGQVLETRKNTAGEVVRNRPGFGYMITRFAYDSDGLLTRMYNLGTEGKELTPDEAGVAMTQISYSPQGQFSQWLNLDMQGKPLKGMSAIAEIVYEPSAYRGEQEAYFFDENGKPQTTSWGAHRVSYKFDQFGNEVQVSYFDANDKPVESSSGIAKVVTHWTKDGLTKLGDTYFDKAGDKVASSYSGVHQVMTDLDEQGRPKRHYFLNEQGELQDHKGLGYAQEVFYYGDSGAVSKRKFLDVKDELVEHNVWKVAFFRYGRDKLGNLLSLKSFDVEGNEQDSQWNPAH